MSITALQVESLPSGGDSIRAWVQTLKTVVAGAGPVHVHGLSERELVATVRDLTAVLSQITAVKLAVLAETDARSAARRVTGATSTAAWLRADGMSAGAASREVALAGSLGQHDATRSALQAGSINAEQAAVITDTLDALSDAVPDADKAATEDRLLEAAARLDPGRLRKEAVAQATRVDPTGSGDLARAERAARAGRDLSLWAGRDGMHHLRGTFDTEAAAVLAAALDPLAAPTPAAGGGGKDPRSPGRRRADALVELARRVLAGDRLPSTGGLRPQVVVTMTLDQLTTRIDAAGIDAGTRTAGTGTDAGCGTAAAEGCAHIAGATVREPLSAAAARRIACDAGIIPAVLGGDSQILDWGRAVRTATPAQRRALALRDGGCTFPGCDRPPEWCEAHHLTAWEVSQCTDLANLTLLCDADHDTAHADGWTATYTHADGVVWHPPAVPPPPEPPLPEPPPPEPPW